jgi:integrase
MTNTEKEPAENHFVFTQARIKALSLKEGEIQAVYWDTMTRRFGLRVSARTKAFFVFTRVNGKATRVSVGRFSDRLPVEAARNEAERLLVEMNAGRNPNAAKRKAKADRGKTVEELYKMKMDTVKGLKLKPTTRAAYDQVYKLHLSKWGNRLVKEITLEDATQLHAAIGKKSPYAANAAIKILKGILSFQESIDFDYRNPLRFFAVTVDMYEEQARKVFIEEHELPLWYKAVTGLWNDAARDYLLLLLFTGLRRNEGMKLKWEDVDLTNNLLTITDTKNGQILRLPISTPLQPIITARKELFGGGVYVFPSTSSKSGHLTTIQHIVKELVDTPGVADFQLHDIRRTFANVAGRLAPWQVVKWLLNHRSKNDVTDRHYVTPDVEYLRENMERIGAELLRMATAKNAE